MSEASKIPSVRRLQYAALPYRKSNERRAEFMLVTSRETRRWIIPKGWPKKGKSPHRSAAREAFEEAGVLGAVGRRPVGSFSYEKRLKNGGSVECEVHVFPLEVKRQKKEWPEKQERRVKWLSASKAAERVKDTALSKIIRNVARAYA
jgi:8-oxo-dGTP pyrophosphatase MutT (NUDIX family)